ncbi:MAG TPA: hypothetical protein VJB14_10710 [Planctomycetota bacterium]|nr:hypothetical protein [Planctomycetota bacterium]
MKPGPDLTARLKMVTRRKFGFSNGAQLNRPLVDALKASTEACETCREIEKEIDATADGAEYLEAPSFPGKTVQKLDAHFKYHWKGDYELVDLSDRAGSAR